MEEMVRIVHNDYNRISDKVMWLSPEYILKFNVDLYSTRNGRNHEKIRDNFHKEYGYIFDNKFQVKINRDFTYYLSIEPTKNSNDRKVYIGPNSIYFLKYKLETIIENWFRNESIFSKHNGRIFIPTMPNPIKVLLDFNAYLEFEPAILQINGEDTIGVRCYVNSEVENFFMPINNLLSFHYCISNFNLYESAQLILNYIGRPENGTNYMEFGNINSNNSYSNNTGFFNRVQQNQPDGN